MFFKNNVTMRVYQCIGKGNTIGTEFSWAIKNKCGRLTCFFQSDNLKYPKTTRIPCVTILKVVFYKIPVEPQRKEAITHFNRVEKELHIGNIQLVRSAFSKADIVTCLGQILKKCNQPVVCLKSVFKIIIINLPFSFPL